MHSLSAEAAAVGAEGAAAAGDLVAGLGPCRNQGRRRKQGPARAMSAQGLQPLGQLLASHKGGPTSAAALSVGPAQDKLPAARQANEPPIANQVADNWTAS
jgi:hypothetical protein